MRTLYLDCFSGIAGDMLLGALIDLGVSLESLRKKLSAISLRRYTLTAKKTTRQGIGGTKFDVKVGRGHAHRGWKEIRALIDGSDLEKPVQEDSLRIFRRLIEVEARVHRVPISRVHLHEVGAVDAIVDIVGSVIALREILGQDGHLVVSPLYLGSGRVTMEHGTFPVPAPATAELIKGLPVISGPVKGELVTPTGAAIVSTLASAFGPMPAMTITGIGYGAGTRQYENHPNLMRAILGETTEIAQTDDQVAVIECNIDDMNPQGYGWLMENLFEAGAVEVYYTPVQMKKNRPGILVTVILPQERFGEIASVLFSESTTIGLRHSLVRRIELAREIVQVKTKHGKVRVKVSSLNGATMHAQPEYDDCRRLAVRRDVPLKEIQAAALSAYRAAGPPAGEGGDKPRRRASAKRRGR